MGASVRPRLNAINAFAAALVSDPRIAEQSMSESDSHGQTFLNLGPQARAFDRVRGSGMDYDFRHTNGHVEELLSSGETGNGRLLGESSDYLTRQLVTYIGNKRSLLAEIGAAVERVKQRLNRSELTTFDAFSGSGVVSRFLKAHSSVIHCNDIEDYAAVISRCYLSNHSSIDRVQLLNLVDLLNRQVDDSSFGTGFIEELYSPRDETNITPRDRVFYTKQNARRLDNYRRLIDHYAGPDTRHLLLAPLLSKASVHSNTAGVFKGFYKNRDTRVGQFGGTGSDALERITASIVMEPPVLSRFECDYVVHQGDTNTIAKEIGELDLAYIDPPYNQHPYGSNYFMLNLLVSYDRPTDISRVSGIPRDWKRSGYNVRSKAKFLLEQLLTSIDATFLLISFNNEGFIKPQAMRAMLNKIGKVSRVDRQYNAFRGSRNFNNRPIHVTESLYLVEKE